MPTIKTIKPGGGGDYSTLASWLSFAIFEASADQWAECYKGNMGVGNISGWTSTPNATTYPRIYAGPGQRHNGINPTSGTHILYTTSDQGGIYNGVGVGPNFLRIEGIATRGAYPSLIVPNSGIYLFDADNLLIDGCLCDGGAVAGFEISSSTDGGVIDVTLQNCIASNSGDTDIIIEAISVVA